MRWEWNGALIQDDLLTREWTQLELAERACVTEATVSRLVNGGSVSIKLARRVARALGRPVRAYLVSAPAPVAPENARETA